MPTLNTNGINLYFETHGSGNPLILLSGLATDSQSWLGCLNELSKSHLIIILDNRGCGRTTPYEAENSISLMAQDVIALLDHLNIQQADVLGNSMGGFIALELALNYPDRVNKLILEATAGKNTAVNHRLFIDWANNMEDSNTDMREWYRETFKWLFHPKIFENTRTLEAKLTYASRYPYQQSPQAFRQQLNAVSEFDVNNDLHKINIPTLILCGKEDLLFSTEYIINNLQHIPSSQIHIIDNAAHAIHVDNPKAFLQEIEQFLLQ